MNQGRPCRTPEPHRQRGRHDEHTSHLCLDVITIDYGEN
jgi:hypothetical protein